MIIMGDTVVDEYGHEDLEHFSPGFLVGCYFDDLEKKSIPWHWHEEMETGIIMDGEVALHTPEHEWRLQKGDGFFINSGTLHEIRSLKGGLCSVRILAFHPKLVGAYDNSIFWEKYVLPVMEHPEIESLKLDQDLQKAKRDLIEAAWISCRNEEYGYESQVREYLTRLLLLIGDGRPKSLMDHAEKSRRYHERMKQMLIFIKDHYGENLTVRDIAGSASVSESECLRCFRTVLDTSPIAYLKSYRLQKAANLLETTSRKISDIAAQCGFGEMSYFAKSFREVYQCTPSQYRNR
nr:AraC family transcriptional regulator [uncultured Merdimonas sp.]